jgi:hypothetical protein
MAQFVACDDAVYALVIVAVAFDCATTSRSSSPAGRTGAASDESTGTAAGDE